MTSYRLGLASPSLALMFDKNSGDAAKKLSWAYYFDKKPPILKISFKLKVQPSSNNLLDSTPPINPPPPNINIFFIF
jgi:hypothetical protein